MDNSMHHTDTCQNMLTSTFHTHHSNLPKQCSISFVVLRPPIAWSLFAHYSVTHPSNVVCSTGRPAAGSLGGMALLFELQLLCKLHRSHLLCRRLIIIHPARLKHIRHSRPHTTALAMLNTAHTRQRQRTKKGGTGMLAHPSIISHAQVAKTAPDQSHYGDLLGSKKTTHARNTHA